VRNKSESTNPNLTLVYLRTKTDFHMQKLFIFGLFAAVLAFTSCKKDLNAADQLAHDKELIKEYLKKKNIVAEETPEGIFYKINSPGGGPKPTVANTVKVNYTGYYLDERIFDQTGGTPIEFPLSNVIEGWQICVPLLARGGTGNFYIPSGLAYGNNPPGSIPEDAVLAFEIELIDFK
jgi:FKBP-type peptidyl-prolyl cis-trans isomerase FkpA